MGQPDVLEGQLGRVERPGARCCEVRVADGKPPKPRTGAPCAEFDL